MFFLPLESKYLILGYHKIVSHARMQVEDLLAISEDEFRRQISWLNRFGYIFVTLSELVRRRKSKIPGRYVAVTFDDGSKDIIGHAYPILQKYKAPATVFVITNFIARELFFPWDLRKSQNKIMILRDEDKSMSWEELFLLSQNGWEIGSHTMSHPHLTEIPADEAQVEIAESKRIIEKTLGVNVTSFCYPARYANLEIAGLVEASGYKYAVIEYRSIEMPNGTLLPNCGNYSINRVSIYTVDSLLKFFVKILGIWELLQHSTLWTTLGIKVVAHMRSLFAAR